MTSHIYGASVSEKSKKLLLLKARTKNKLSVGRAQKITFNLFKEEILTDLG